MTLMDDVGAIIDRWASMPYGFIRCPDRKPEWVPVQQMAQRYAYDERRNDDETKEAWRQSAKKFIEAVDGSSSWCLDPGIVAMMDDSMPPDDRPLPPPYEQPCDVEKPKKRKAKVKA